MEHCKFLNAAFGKSRFLFHGFYGLIHRVAFCYINEKHLQLPN